MNGIVNFKLQLQTGSSLQTLSPDESHMRSKQIAAI